MGNPIFIIPFLEGWIMIIAPGTYGFKERRDHPKDYKAITISNSQKTIL